MSVAITANVVDGVVVTSNVTISTPITASVVTGGKGADGADGADGVDGADEQFHVTSYGALFDGTTDDTAAVQDAIDAANTAGGGIVVMPPGTGRYSGELVLYPGVTLRGQGKFATTWSTLETSGALTDGHAITFNSDSDDYITIEGFELLGQGETDTSGTGIEDTSSVNSFIKIRDMYIHQFPDDGIYLYDPIVSSIDDVWVRDNGRDGIFIEVGTTMVISSIYASGNNRCGVHLKTHVASTLDNVVVEYNTFGIWLESCGNITLNSPYGEIAMLGDGGTLGSVAFYRVQSSQNIIFNGAYSNSFAYLNGVSAYHYQITGSSRVILNAVRGKALLSAEVGEGEAPTNTILIDSSSTVEAHLITFSDEIGAGQSGNFVNETTITGRTTTSATNASLNLSRNANTNSALTVYRTGSTDYWSTGMRNDSTADYHVRDVVNSRSTIKVDGSTGNVTLSTPGNTANSALTTDATQTLTNKRVNRRVVAVSAPGATPTTNTDNVDIAEFTGLATAITSMTTSLSGTPVEGQMVEFVFLDDGTPRAITWGASFANGGLVSLPSTTVTSVVLRVLVQYQTLASLNKFVCIGVA